MGNIWSFKLKKKEKRKKREERDRGREGWRERRKEGGKKERRKQGKSNTNVRLFRFPKIHSSCKETIFLEFLAHVFNNFILLQMVCFFTLYSS